MLALKPFTRIAKNMNIRATRSALEEVRAIIDEEAERISIEAVRLCFHANRRTILKDDIILASER